MKQTVTSILAIVLLIILILTVLSGCSFNTCNKEDFQNEQNIVYVNDKTFAQAITLSPFFRNLSPIDLLARGNSKSQAEYATTYFSSKETFTEKDKDILSACISQANNILKDFPKIQQAPWNFVKVRAIIENGFPHTIHNIIVLSDKALTRPINDLTKTLIHEKMHVAQRTYTTDFIELYEMIGFKKTRDISRHELARANPDIDNNLYVYKNTRKVPMQLYSSKYPSSINDSKAMLVSLDGNMELATQTSLGLPEDIHCQLEHPNEIVACIMAEMLTYPDMSYIQKNETLSTIWKWMVMNWK